MVPVSETRTLSSVLGRRIQVDGGSRKGELQFCCLCDKECVCGGGHKRRDIFNISLDHMAFWICVIRLTDTHSDLQLAPRPRGSGRSVMRAFVWLR